MSQPVVRGSPRGSERALDATLAEGREHAAHTGSASPTAGAGSERFELRGELGRGGMGVVHTAYDHRIRREVALKVLLATHPTDEERARFVQEGQVTGQLAHPNIPPVYELGTTPEGRPYFAMKIVRGESLRSRLDALRSSRDSAREFPLPQRIDVLVKVGEALAYAHAHGVVHRDLKPDNVLIGEFGEVQVMDWGLAKVRGTDSLAAGRSAVVSDRLFRAELVTMHGALAGTPAYMAPEQARGEVQDIDHRTDVFALGALLYEMLCLSPPYRGASVAETLALAERATWIPVHARLRADGARVAPPPRELAAIAHRAMAAEPRDRYADVGAMLADVRAYREHEPVTAYRDSTLGRLSKWGQRHPRTMVVLALALVIATVVTHFSSARARAFALAERKEIEALQAQAARDHAEAARDHAEAVAIRAFAERSTESARADALGALVMKHLSSESRAAIDEFRATVAASGSNRANFDELEGRFKPTQIDRYLAAYDRLFEAYALTGGRPGSSECFDRAILHHAKGELELALRDYDQAIAIAPDNVGTLWNRGIVRKARGDLDGAIADLDRALAIDPTCGAEQHRAQVHVMRGALDLAAADLDQLLARDPRNATALGDRALLRAARGDDAGAAVDLEQALAIDPSCTVALIGRGSARRLAGDLAGSLADLDRALAVSPRSSLALANRGATRLLLDDWDGAEADLDLSLSIAPKNAIALVDRGRVRVAQGDRDGAIPYFDRALEVDPACAHGLVHRGNARRDAGGYDLALADYDRALAIVPRNVDVLVNRGLALKLKGDLAGALADFELAIEVDPRCVPAIYNRGVERAARGDRSGALADYDRALSIEPDHPESRNNRGVLRRVTGDLAGALEDFDRVIAVRPRAQAFANRAAVYLDQGDSARALADLGRALEQDPRCVDALGNRASVRLAQGALADALADLDHALSIDPSRWELDLNRGVVLERLGRTSDALGAYREAYRRCRDDLVRARLADDIHRLGGSPPGD